MRKHEILLRTGFMIGLGVAAYGCATLPETALTALDRGPDGAVQCASAPASPVSREVGPQGDSLALEMDVPAGRRHALIVPAGAVAQGERITFTLADPMNGYVSVNATHGGNGELQRPVTLRLSYRGCGVSTDDAQGLQMYRLQAGAWVPVPSRVDVEREIVEAERDNLSAYALAAG